MAAASDYLEGEIIKHLLRTGSWTKPSTIAIALCTSAPVDADTGALTAKEVTNVSTGYVRQTLNPLDANWTAPGVGGPSDNASAITFPVATANYGTVTHVAICDNAGYGSGNLLLWGALTTPKTVNTGDTFRFAIGDLDIYLA